MSCKPKVEPGLGYSQIAGPAWFSGLPRSYSVGALVVPNTGLALDYVEPGLDHASQGWPRRPEASMLTRNQARPLNQP